MSHADPATTAPRPRPWRMLLRKARAAGDLLLLHIDVVGLAVRNRVSRAPVTGDLDVWLSVTTFGRRTDRAYLAYESALRGRDRPRRVILWLDEEETLANLPRTLRRMQRRGLEIVATNNYGPHKKLYPLSLTQTRHRTPVATCDDDVVYPRDWLRRLVEGHRSAPDAINGFRARVIEVMGERIAPYSSWPLCQTTDPSFRHLLTNVSGNIYPASFVDVVRDAGEGFLRSSATADDIWLHHLALRHGYRVRQIDLHHQEMGSVPGSQASSLFDHNVVRGENDRIIERLYTDADIDVIRADR